MDMLDGNLHFSVKKKLPNGSPCVEHIGYEPYQPGRCNDEKGYGASANLCENLMLPDSLPLSTIQATMETIASKSDFKAETPQINLRLFAAAPHHNFLHSSTMTYLALNLFAVLHFKSLG